MSTLMTHGVYIFPEETLRNGVGASPCVRPRPRVRPQPCVRPRPCVRPLPDRNSVLDFLDGERTWKMRFLGQNVASKRHHFSSMRPTILLFCSHFPPFFPRTEFLSGREPLCQRQCSLGNGRTQGDAPTPFAFNGRRSGSRAFLQQQQGAHHGY
jgi:hypothetical protein